MLDEISEKFQFGVTYARIFRHPFAFIKQFEIDVKEKRKEAWKFFFFAISIVIGIAAFTANVITSNGLEKLCPELAGSAWAPEKPLSLLLVVVTLLTAAFVHVAYRISGHVFTATLVQYLAAVALYTGFVALTVSVPFAVRAVAADSLVTQFGANVARNCGLEKETIIIKGFSFDTSSGQITPEVERESDDPLAVVHDSPLPTILFISTVVAFVASGFGFLIYISWTATIYKSTWRRAFFTIFIALLPVGLLQENSQALFESASGWLDSTMPTTLRDTIKSTVGI